MMDWMKGFGDRFDHEEIMKGKELSPEKQEWLKEEEAKVKDMAEKVTGSIARAKALLKAREQLVMEREARELAALARPGD